MSMSKIGIQYFKLESGASLLIPEELLPEFKKMVQRATSTWQDMSPEMRDFADRVLGVDSIMGQNMKLGHSSNTISPSSKDIDWDAVPKALIRIAEFKAQYLNAPVKLCDGHPETCGCPQHWQG